MLYNMGVQGENSEAGKPTVIRERGLIGLADQQKATFTDKFREGSYLRIQYKKGLNKEAFDSSWTLLENDVVVSPNQLAIWPGLQTVHNSGEYITTENAPGYAPSDGRVVKNEGNTGDINPNNPGTVQNQEKDTIVYGSYQNPDNPQKQGIDLIVAYKHVLKVGCITITKNLDRPAEEDEIFRFHIHFDNIAGMNLKANLPSENLEGEEAMIHEVMVKVPKGQTTASVTIEGIPYRLNILSMQSMRNLLVCSGEKEQTNSIPFSNMMNKERNIR